MANDFSANPWFIDTAYSTPPTSPAHITNSMVYVKSVTWSDQVAGGDQLLIKDRNGKIIQDAKAQAANATIILNNPGWVEGFMVPTLASGKLSVVVSK